MTVMLQAEDVTVSIGGEQLVAPVSLCLHAGRPFTILGETGSGKSLLAQALIGTLPKDLKPQGRVTVSGRPIDLAGPDAHHALWGRVIGILPQEPWLALDPLMDCQSQVAEGYAFVAGQDWKQAQASAKRDLATLGLRNLVGLRPDQLSGGMQQRVAFAAARTGGARIFIADEPTKGLDVPRRDEVISLLLDEVAKGGALLTITHDLALARHIGGDVAIFLDGRIIEQGPADIVLNHPQHAYTARLIAADPASWPEPAGRAPVRAALLRGKDLSVARGGRTLVADLNLEIGEGEIVGVIGPSGCGKSTLGDVFLGLHHPQKGAVLKTAAHAPWRYQKLYQDPPSAFPRHRTIGSAIDDVIRRHSLDPSRIPALLSRLGLSSALLARKPSDVSGGELQRLALLRALLVDPVFMFADEPTSRLDLITQADVIGLLTEIVRETGMSLLIVSHDVDLIRKIADRTVILPEGRFLEPQAFAPALATAV